MALFNRVSRLLRADLHAVLDRVEEPEVLLRQAVREMETAIAEERRRAALLEHELAQLDRRAGETDAALARIASELDVCFDAGEEDLARRLVRRRLELERGHEQLQRRRAGQQAALAGLRRTIDEHQAQLDATREKAELLAGDDGVGDADAGAAAAPAEPTVSAEDVEIALLAEKRRRSMS